MSPEWSFVVRFHYKLTIQLEIHRIVSLPTHRFALACRLCGFAPFAITKKNHICVYVYIRIYTYTHIQLYICSETHTHNSG